MGQQLSSQISSAISISTMSNEQSEQSALQTQSVPQLSQSKTNNSIRNIGASGVGLTGLNENQTSRMIWCNYIPDDCDDSNAHNYSKVFMLARKNQAHIFKN